MVEAGQRDGLLIQGNVGDVLTFEPPGMFDVVILGYVLHTLANDEERWGSRGLFQSALRKVQPGGHLLVSETPGNTIDVFGLLSNGKHGRWEVTVKTNNCVIARRGHLEKRAYLSGS
jgi:SAM-dependent methyltransferase